MQSSMTTVPCSRAQSHLHAGPRRGCLATEGRRTTGNEERDRRAAVVAPGRRPWGGAPPAPRRPISSFPSSPRLVIARAGAMDGMPAWTLDQIAGLAFGGVMLAAVLASQQVDEWVARAQRRGLGVCERCGGANGDRASGGCAERGCPLRSSGGGNS